MSGRGATSDATSAAADKVGAGGRHGARPRVEDKVASRQENPAGKSSGVGGKGGSRETYRVASKPSGVSGEGGSCEAYGVVETPPTA